MRRTAALANLAAFYEFVDSNFLNNKRPPIPGGAWPLESLRNKSLADLQQIWFSLVKERNMLSTTKEHYMKHQEELGAMPAPSRLEMVEESMANIKQAVRERDAAAVQQATEIFRERLAKGQYRYPPGPPPPPGAHDKTSAVKLVLSRRVSEDRLRALLGRFDRFDAHKGIVSVELRLPEKVLEEKREAEQLWQQYRTECSDAAEYHKWALMGPSVMDYTEVELAPGVMLGTGMDGGSGSQAAAKGEDTEGSSAATATTWSALPSAAQLPVPEPKTAPPPPSNPLDRIKYQRRATLGRTVIQLGYFPNITQTKPRYVKPEDVPRPVHPDEINGPWEAIITYDTPNGLDYVQSLGLTRMDGADVLSVEAQPRQPQPFAEVDPIYQEAIREEMAAEETQMKWPHVPEWKYSYDVYTRKHLADIVQYNYSNVVDYVDREVLLTGKSVWECPIDIDPTCGGMKSVPAHAKRPKRVMTPGIGHIGVTDI